MPSRLSSLRKVLPRILPQIDRLFLFLDKYKNPPAEAIDPKISVLMSSVYGDRLLSSGKLLGLTFQPSSVVYVMFDDDILYPKNYVNSLVAGLIRHGGKAMVGYHGSRFIPPYSSYMRDRQVFRFQKALLFDRQVDMLGSGTSAFLSDAFDMDPRCWPYGDMDDLMIAIEATRRRIPRVALRRRSWYLREVPEKQSESIYQDTLRDETRQAALLAQLVTLLGFRS